MPRTQRTEAETRALVAEAVIGYVARNGIGVTPELPMERIVELAGVSRASAYRLWSGRSAFSAFALEQCARGHAIGTLDGARARVLAEEAVAAEKDRLVSAGRFVAGAADEEILVMLRSDQWRAFVAFQAIAVQTGQPEIEKLLARIDQEDVARLAAFYHAVAEVWGLEVVAGSTIESIATAALLVARSTVARSMNGGIGPQARRAYLTALEALVRGSFRAKPGRDVELHRLAFDE